MDLYSQVCRDEQHPIYLKMSSDNLVRYYSFLSSVIDTAVALNEPWLSEPLIKAINFHAIVGLHEEAGRYRSSNVEVGDYHPPTHDCVNALMLELMNELEANWESGGAVELATHALWRVNNIHPFVNGNGRTARAICYFILCVKLGGLLPGRTILPERLRLDPARSSDYIPALREADRGNVTPLRDLIGSLLNQQITEI